MKKTILRCMAAALSLTAMSAQAEITLIQNTKGMLPTATALDDPALANIDGICEADSPNCLEFGLRYTTVGSGFKVFQGTIAAGGKNIQHANPVVDVVYIISGTGTMTTSDAEGNIIERVAYGPHDMIVFHPNTQHGWEGGPEPTELIVFEQSPKE